MASITKRPKGHRWIQFTDSDNKRQTIRLGKATKKHAQEVATKVEALNAAKIAKLSWDNETAKWVADIGDALHGKLAKRGLVPERTKTESVTLATFIDSYIEGRKDVKPATKEVWRQGKLGLVKQFGTDRDLTTISAGDADDYKQAMIAEGLAPLTIRKRLQWAKTWFKSAKRKRLISDNPFDEVSVNGTMPDKMHFVTRADTKALLDACPDHDWRMIVALCRFGGLRCPSEVLSLRWEDIDWQNQLIEVQSPKTEHHEGKATRLIPLFPELYPYLRTSFERAQDGALFVVNERFRKSAMGKSGWRNCNLRTTFEKIIKRAGLKKWPRLFHNLRSSRQTELEDQFPSHVVCAWMGNSEKVARKHYLQVTPDHIAKALQTEGKSGSGEGEAKPEAVAKQNPKQQPAAMDRIIAQIVQEAQEKVGAVQVSAAHCNTLHGPNADGVGFEPTVALRLRQFSRLVPSTTRPPIRYDNLGRRQGNRRTSSSGSRT